MRSLHTFVRNDDQEEVAINDDDDDGADAGDVAWWKARRQLSNSRSHSRWFTTGRRQRKRPKKKVQLYFSVSETMRGRIKT